MARKRRKSSFMAGELNLVAMIDVAFQLLNFFIISIRPVDTMTHLAINRPQAEKKSQEESTANVIRITVFPDGYSLNERLRSMAQMRQELGSLAAISTKQSILIQVTQESTHGKLVDLLDMCAELRLTDLNVVSSGAY
ncbi:MAG: biopolymer transporter ExbD [bacterium]